MTRVNKFEPMPTTEQVTGSSDSILMKGTIQGSQSPVNTPQNDAILHGDDLEMIRKVHSYPLSNVPLQQLTTNLQGPAIRHEIGDETPSDPVKGKGKASMSSTTVTTPTSLHLLRTSWGRSPSAAQSAFTTPDTQGSLLGDPNKASPPILPSMLPLPGPALDASAPPPEHGQLIGAAKPSANMSVNKTRLSNLADVARFFSTGKTDILKEGFEINVEQVRVSGRIHTNIQCTGKESGIKLRHEGELTPPETLHSFSPC